MNVNATAIGTPCGERYNCAASKFALGDISCFARGPVRLAGESRKTLRIHEKYAVIYRQLLLVHRSGRAASSAPFLWAASTIRIARAGVRAAIAVPTTSRVAKRPDRPPPSRHLRRATRR